MTFLRPALAFLLLCFAAAPAIAGVVPGVRYETRSGGVVQWHGRTHGVHNTTVGYVRKGGNSSDKVTATPTAGGCDGETQDSPEMTVENGDGSDSTFRVQGGEMQEQDPVSPNVWHNLSPAPNGPQPTNAPGGDECIGLWGNPPPSPSPTRQLTGNAIGSHPAWLL